MTRTNAKNILQTILQTKREEVELKQQHVSLAVIEKQARDCQLPLRSFRQNMLDSIQQKRPTVIAELKKASPSKGVIRADFDLFALSRAYKRGGATCLSVLTDHTYFQGHDSFLQEVRETVDLPLLRKDFILCDYQVYESKILGADAILLIAAALPPAQLEQLCLLAIDIGLDVIIEVHSIAEYKVVSHLADKALIGVNNRNLETFEVNLKISLDIHSQLPADQHIITESGIHQRAQVEVMLQAGIYGFLVGEAFMRYQDPTAGLAELFPELNRP